MSEETGTPGPPEPRGVQPARWVRRVVLALVLVVLAFAAYRVAAEFFPRWWARQLAGLIGGSTATGVIWGLVLGLVFTAVPLLVLSTVRRLRWPGRIVVIVFAVLLAAPMWLTAAVAFGGGGSARQGRSLLAEDGPGYLTGSWIGAAAGIVLAVGLLVWRVSARRRRAELHHLQDDLAAREEADRLRREAQERQIAERRRDLPPQEPGAH